jgi:CheY-like chemotaxis protein
VRLPESGIAGTHEPTPVVPAIAVAPPSERGSISRILIADDNRDAADTLAELLRLDGYEVYVVYDGEDALSTFMQLTPHAALLDVGMPRLSGIEVVRAIREHPSGLHAILIAVTGWAEEKDRRAALEAGFDHHITKPMDPASIQALIDRGRKGRAAPVV